MKNKPKYASQSSEAIKKQNLKRTLKRNFSKLIPDMDKCEYDALMYELKSMYEANNNDS